MKWKKSQSRGEAYYEFDILDLDNRPIIELWIARSWVQQDKFELNIRYGKLGFKMVFDSVKESKDYAKKYLSYLKEQMK